MCGRIYSTYTEEELSARYFNRKPIRFPQLVSRYNTAPSQNLPVIRRPRAQEEPLQLDLFRWGLVPSWADDTKIGYKMINARAETLAQKPSFRNAFAERRCIIPVSGFYEWKKINPKIKQPFAIHLKDTSIMSLAGIWEHWKGKEGETLHTFSIITTAANAAMTEIHNRMPVILNAEAEERWLTPQIKNTQELEALLKPCPPEWLVAYEVSQLVNNPRNNRPENLEPLKPEQLSLGD